MRARHAAICGDRTVLYALYELDGSVGVWQWNGKSVDGSGCGSLGDELSRAPVAWPSGACAQNSSELREWQPTCMNAQGTIVMRPFPTELAISNDGRTLYVSSAQQPEPRAGAANGTISVYATASRAPYLELRQVYPVASGARSLALSTSGDFLLTADPVLGVLSSLQLDRTTGQIVGVAGIAAGVRNASSIVVGSDF